MESIEQLIAELKERYGNKAFFTFPEVMVITGLKKDALYDLLAAGQLLAHNPAKAPSGRGTRIIACSVWDYIRNGIIQPDKFSK